MHILILRLILMTFRKYLSFLVHVNFNIQISFRFLHMTWMDGRMDGWMGESSSGSEYQCFLCILSWLTLLFSGFHHDGRKEGMSLGSEDR